MRVRGTFLCQWYLFVSKVPVCVKGACKCQGNLLVSGYLFVLWYLNVSWVPVVLGVSVVLGGTYCVRSICCVRGTYCVRGYLFVPEVLVCVKGSFLCQRYL